MSENTNTLFWFITGAVIVLGVFLLINTSQNSNLNNITNKFDSLFTGDNYEQIEQEDYSIYFKNDDSIKENYKEIFACGSKTEVVDGYKVGVHDYYDRGKEGSLIRWIITNTNETIKNGAIFISFLNCSNNEQVSSAYWSLNDIKPNETITLWTHGENIPQDYQFYIKVRLEVY